VSGQPENWLRRQRFCGAAGSPATSIQVGMMNAPAVDLVAMKGSRNVRIAVKTSGASGNMQWSVKRQARLEYPIQGRDAAGLRSLRLVL
jgi:hypothetical protein